MASFMQPKPPPHLPANERTTYPSAARPLDVHIYLPSSNSHTSLMSHSRPTDSPANASAIPGLPVHIHMHGSGFTLPSHGADSLFCRRLADAAKCVVLDIDYRHAPEDPWPAALEDVQCARRWVESVAGQMGWDAGRISIGGMSAGGNLALVSAGGVADGEGIERPKGSEGRSFLAVVAFYPSTNLAENASDKPKVKPAKGASGSTIPAPIRKLFYACYLPKGVDRAAPSVSVLNADPTNFPHNITIVTCTGDSLQREALQLAGKLKAVGKNVETFEAAGQGHGWDLGVKSGTEPAKLRDEAYKFAAERLKVVFDSKIRDRKGP